MLLFTAFSGLSGLFTDAREFLAAVRLSRPYALLLLFILVVLAALNLWSSRRRKRAIKTIGRPAAISGQLTHPHSSRGFWKWLGLTYPIAWVVLILGIVGPRWGKGEETGVAVGRDLVIVIDL